MIRTVFAGAAAEQWFNAELFRYIASTDLKGLTAYPEVGKRDLAILVVPDNGGAPEPVLFVEVKLVYYNYSAATRDAKIAKLVEQMKPRRDGTRCIGFLLGVYAHYEKPEDVREDFGHFRRDICARAKRITDDGSSFRVRLAKPAMETFVSEGSVRIGERRAHVGVVAQYLISTGR